MEFVILQHAERLPGGLLDELLSARRRPARTERLWSGEPVPAAAEGLRALVVLGDVAGDQGDQAVQRDAEQTLLRACVALGVPVLAIGASAALLAEATGGRSEPDGGRVGFTALERTAEAIDDAVFASYPDGMAALSLRAGAVVPGPESAILAVRPDGGCAAFRVGAAAYGLDFHPELDERLVTAVAPLLALQDSDALVAEAHRRDAFHRGMGAGVLGRFIDLVVGRTEAEQPWGRRGPQPVPAPGLSLHPE